MKIQSITINKFKAFTKEETIPVGGSNVFIYGENGSMNEALPKKPVKHVRMSFFSSFKLKGSHPEFSELNFNTIFK